MYPHMQQKDLLITLEGRGKEGGKEGGSEERRVGGRESGREERRETENKEVREEMWLAHTHTHTHLLGSYLALKFLAQLFHFRSPPFQRVKEGLIAPAQFIPGRKAPISLPNDLVLLHSTLCHINIFLSFFFPDSF